MAQLNDIRHKIDARIASRMVLPPSPPPEADECMLPLGEDSRSGPMVVDATAATATTADPSEPMVVDHVPSYKNHYWPSPRPKNFAKGMEVKFSSHLRALQFLASNEEMTVEKPLLDDAPMNDNIRQ